LILDSPDVSRLHAKFALEQGEYYFYDLGSANGSLVNGKLAHPNQGYLLKPGDIIRVGEFALILYPIGELEELPATVLDNPNATVFERRSPTIFSDNYGVAADSQGAEDQEVNLPSDKEPIPEDQAHLTGHSTKHPTEGEEEVDLPLADFAIVDGNISDLNDAIENDNAIAEENISNLENKRSNFVEASETSPMEEDLKVEGSESEAEAAAPLVEPSTTELSEALNSETSQREIDSEHFNSPILSSDDQFEDQLSELGSVSSVESPPLVSDYTVIQLEEFVEQSEPNLDTTAFEENEVIGTDSEPPPVSTPIDPERLESAYFEGSAAEIPELKLSSSADTESGNQSDIQLDDNGADIDSISNEESDSAEVVRIPELEPALQSSSTELNETEADHIKTIATETESATVQPVDADKLPVAIEQVEDEDEEVKQDETELDEVERIDQLPSANEPDASVREAEETEEPATLKREAPEEDEAQLISEDSPSEAIASDEGTPAVSISADLQTAVPVAPNEKLAIFSEKYVALLAHDSQIPALVELVAEHQDFFSHCLTVTTPSISEVLKREVGLEVSHQTPTVPPGGYQTVNRWITAEKILAVIFLRDFLIPQATQANDEAFVRSCHVHQVLFASNLPTAGALAHYLQSQAFVAKQ
jgi:methylglyoxal synthase/pSer/pThr/pTyr-binding forkhead associated (FHA) protein